MTAISKAKTQELLDEIEWNRDVNHIQKLISEGADVNAKDEWMYTPLHNALKIFSYDTLCKLKSELAESGASGKYAGESDVWKIIETRIKRAVDVVVQLLRNGANVNAKTRGRCTPLYLATGVGQVFVIFRYLMDIWPDLELSGQIENSVLEAADQTAIQIVELLLSNGADVNGKDPDDSSSESDTSSVCGSRWIDYSAHSDEFDLGRTQPLHAAIDYGSTSVVELLLKHQAIVNALDDSGQTPLHVAVNESTYLIELLLKHGADVNARDVVGESPLFKALRRGKRSILDLLLEHGANVNIETTSLAFMQTPLTYAVSFLSPEMVIFLLEHGAKVNPENPLISPLHCAVNRHSPSIVKLLLEHGADVNARNDDDRTPLHFLLEISCLKTFKDMLDLLLEHGADLEARDDLGRTPVFFITDNIGHFTKKPKEFLAAINEIFSHGVCVDVTDGYYGLPFYDHLREHMTVELSEINKSILLNHVRKLIALSVIHMAKKNRPLFFEIVDPFKKDCTRLEQKNQENPLEKGDDLYYVSCLGEVDILKTIQIFKNITLADVLTLGDPGTLASISNTVLQQYSQSVDLNSKFPNYAFVISHQCQKGLQMKLLFEKCGISLGIMSSGKLHKYCAHEVSKYLSAIDLKNLAEAVNR